jgi:2',3'-cyclic-nucleotide 2'-phosphodiesterase (5'-nucleotidase family)
MPFENNLMVIALKGDQIREMAEYLLKEKKPHPLSGIKIYFNSELKIKAIVVGTSPLDLSKTYYVATSDYLSNGGDNMIFFQKNEGTFDLDYKIRNVLIDHFKEVDTLKVSMDKRIIVE